MRILITGGAGFLGQRLARRLLQNPELKQLVLADVRKPTFECEGAERVLCVQADLTNPQAAADLISADLTGVYHLAAVVSAQAEADFDLGMRVNCDGTRNLLEAVRHGAPGITVVFASSLAVYGGDLPDVITDKTQVTPQSSYGTEKAISELMVKDYSRKGFIDGRTLRLPTVCVRPGKPNAAASSFASSIIREPLKGDRAICPVDPALPLWISGPDAVVDNLVHGLSVAGEKLGASRAINLPGLTISVADMIAALKTVAGTEAIERIDYQPDPAISAIVASWPSRFDVNLAQSLGFSQTDSFEGVIRRFCQENES